jgi:hypothetical protein
MHPGALVRGAAQPGRHAIFQKDEMRACARPVDRRVHAQISWLWRTFTGTVSTCWTFAGRSWGGGIFGALATRLPDLDRQDLLIMNSSHLCSCCFGPSLGLHYVPWIHSAGQSPPCCSYWQPWVHRVAESPCFPQFRLLRRLLLSRTTL